MPERQHWPAAERNREPILAVLRRVLPEHGCVLEIASGTGQHAAYFSRALSGLQWQPTEHNAELLPSIAAWAKEEGGQVLPPIALDVLVDEWPLPQPSYDAIYNANMIHIAPIEVCHGLLRGVATHLKPSGPFVLYGPFRLGGQHTAQSNADFDQRLREQDARWGVRDADEVIALAASHGLSFVERVAMPANNQMLIFRRDR